MKIKFRNAKLSATNKHRLQQINEIIEEYQEQDLVLTLRQLYYQLVSRDIIPNQQKEYSKLSTLLKEGRMSGIVDWNAIEDRLRQVDRPSSWTSPKKSWKLPCPVTGKTG
jgi:tagatose-1,6-bisphosphate aldolase